MSTADTANLVTPSSGLQGLQGTITTSDILSSSREPVTGPDGRFLGDKVTRPTAEEAGITYDLPNLTKESEEMIKVEPVGTGTAKVTELKPSSAASKPEVNQMESKERVVDIVKQSKLKEISKTVNIDNADTSDLPASRPITETSYRDGSKITIQEPEHKKEKAESAPIERDSRTPFSVSVERKPLHTAQTRSHSDYYSKASSTSRYTYIAASLGHFNGFPPDFRGKENFFRQQGQHRSRRPPKLVRLATVTMEPRTKPAPRGPSLYYEEPKKPTKVITWDEANEARPPLRIDMEGPCPTSYSPRVKPLYETNSPSWTFGTKCLVEKGGGARTSWEKTWFQSPNVWTNKVDFYSDTAWPAPTHYRQRTMLGPRQRTTLEAPSFTIGVRKDTTMSKAGSDKEPSPVDYDKDLADKVVLKKGPAYSHQFRRSGTVMWGSKDKTPGPGSYDPNFGFNKRHGPNFTIRSMRREKSHVLGPFSTF